ncbi:NUDIX hydrolase [Paenisporosarcina indica]|uniref:NUDIX hydrolase n=1 Tax=Paenisporosarcina indica TaxID=650093 RepID=UPI0009500616|nr:NUDIX domain-containing protein [Paenisporosarcina indica]
MRRRGSAVLINNKKVALIKRVQADSVYYVFPGGGIEVGETPEEATIRETYEELGVHIKINESRDSFCFNGSQYFFLADIVDGVFGTGQGEEFLQNASDKGTYEPMWVDIHTLDAIDVKPKEISDKIQNIFR